MKHSILCHEGKTKVVVAIGDYIQFSDAKVWIGGSMVEGEPISELWLERFDFKKMDQDVWSNGNLDIVLGNNFFTSPLSRRTFQYCHQLQMLHYTIVGEHLKLPKIKK